MKEERARAKASARVDPKGHRGSNGPNGRIGVHFSSPKNECFSVEGEEI